MIKIVFVCHGNICRSPMAEFLFKDFVKKKGTSDKFIIESRATSREEIGNSVHYGTKRILEEHHIDCSKKRAKQLCIEDYDYYDYIIGMDAYNLRNMEKLFQGKTDKLHLLLDFTGCSRDIADPWYSLNFEQTYKDIQTGLLGFYHYLEQNKLI